MNLKLKGFAKNSLNPHFLTYFSMLFKSLQKQQTLATNFESKVVLCRLILVKLINVPTQW